jgi:predicted NAD-dependent protein-ADP-ribosyltransferase YbiA (DUF1768 family)
MSDAITDFHGQHNFLSNFFPVAIEYNGLTYPSVEHAFQAQKVTDHGIHRRKLKLREDWETVKMSVMGELLRIKFAQPYLRYQLVGTGDAELIEGNTWGDKYWGCIWVGPDPGPGHWHGENHLGKLLMKIRAEVRDAK